MAAEPITPGASHRPVSRSRRSHRSRGRASRCCGERMPTRTPSLPFTRELERVQRANGRRGRLRRLPRAGELDHGGAGGGGFPRSRHLDPRRRDRPRSTGIASWTWSTFIDLEQLETDQSPYLVSTGHGRSRRGWPADDGHLFGAFTWVNVKGLSGTRSPSCARPATQSRRRGKSSIELSRSVEGRRRDALVHGLRVGRGRSGGRPPTGSRTSCSPRAGPEAYDDWTFHRLPFDSPPIRRAFEQFGDVVFTDGSVLGGPEAAAVDVLRRCPASDDGTTPPRCWLLPVPDVRGCLPSTIRTTSGRATDTFPFPALDGRTRGRDRRRRDDRCVLRSARGSRVGPVLPQRRARDRGRGGRASSTCHRT